MVQTSQAMHYKHVGQLQPTLMSAQRLLWTVEETGSKMHDTGFIIFV